MRCSSSGSSSLPQRMCSTSSHRLHRPAAVHPSFRTRTAHVLSALHDRDTEKNLLVQHADQQPSTILGLLGPSNSGKSTLLQYMVTDGPFKDRALYLDCRDLQGSMPSAFATQALQVPLPSVVTNSLDAQLRQDMDRIKNSTSPSEAISLTISTIAPSVLQVLGDEQKSEEQQSGSMIERGVKAAATRFLQVVGSGKQAATASKKPGTLEFLCQYLSEFVGLWHYLKSKSKLSGYPIIIVDEANMLYSWNNDNQDKKCLENLLALFVALSKQNNQCHIILASSDFGFLDFMAERGVQREMLTIGVVNGFEKAQAKVYLEKEMKRAGFDEPIGSILKGSMWDSIYEVTGGNPQLLKSVAKSMYNREDNKPDACLDAITADASSALRDVVGLPTAPTELFLPYAQLAIALVDSKLNALSYEHALELLAEPFLSIPDYRERDRVMKDLVRRNVIMVRPPISWGGMSESSNDVFGSKSALGVFPPGRSRLNLMELKRPELQKALDTAKQQWQQQREEEEQYRQWQREKEVKEEQYRQQQREEEEQYRQRQREKEEKEEQYRQWQREKEVKEEQYRQWQREKEVKEEQYRQQRRGIEEIDEQLEALRGRLSLTPFFDFNAQKELRRAMREKYEAKLKLIMKK